MTSELKLVVSSLFAALLIGCTATSPAPVSSVNKDYDAIERGSYRGSYYEVNKGDTLYFIAYITGKDVKKLISYNNLSAPYTIHPGQKLHLWRPAYKAPAYGSSTASAAVVSPASTPIPASKTASNVNSSNTNNSQNAKKTVTNKLDPVKSKEYVGSQGKQNVNKTVNKAKPKNDKISKWLWPTKGRVIKSFSAGDQGNKGIDIAGQRSQSIVSTARGTVVYSGNALRGYGNLIIVKHNDNYLSAYAHNDRLLVQEGQSVKAGQKIATMGSSGSNRVKLHFEIRYQGKSVNPKRYLP